MHVDSRALVLAALLAAPGCGPASHFQPPDDGDRLGVWAPDPGSTLLQTAQSSLTDPTLAVVSDTSTWRPLWTRAWPGPQAAPQLPTIDFVLTSVVVVGLGTRAGLGYTVTIDSIVTRTAGATLFATESKPGSHCDTGTGISSPVHMVHAPGHPPVIAWDVRTISVDCIP
ncbi:MAG: protease complex subunit PrcB family protein [Gemmatimonadales bacterium]